MQGFESRLARLKWEQSRVVGVNETFNDTSILQHAASFERMAPIFAEMEALHEIFALTAICECFCGQCKRSTFEDTPTRVSGRMYPGGAISFG